MRGSSLILLALLAACGAEPGPRAPDSEAASPVAAATAAPPQEWEPLQALGTEPFWSVEVRTGTLRYSTPENIEGTSFPAKRQADGQRVTYTGTFEGKPFTLVILPGQCSDGMSDTVYPLTATRSLGEDLQRGCARLRN